MSKFRYFLHRLWLRYRTQVPPPEPTKVWVAAPAPHTKPHLVPKVDIADYSIGSDGYYARYDSVFAHEASKVKGVDWKLLKAQAMAESLMNETAVSRAGAKGLMQFMPRTWKEWGEGSQLDSTESIRAAARYMSWLLDRPAVNNDVWKAFAAYNWGIGNITRTVTEHEASWKRYIPKETKQYLARIKRYAKS